MPDHYCKDCGEVEYACKCSEALRSMAALAATPILPEFVADICVDQDITLYFYMGHPLWRNYTYGYTDLTKEECITAMKVAMENLEFLPPLEK